MAHGQNPAIKERLPERRSSKVSDVNQTPESSDLARSKWTARARHTGWPLHKGRICLVLQRRLRRRSHLEGRWTPGYLLTQWVRLDPTPLLYGGQPSLHLPHELTPRNIPNSPNAFGRCAGFETNEKTTSCPGLNSRFKRDSIRSPAL